MLMIIVIIFGCCINKQSNQALIGQEMTLHHFFNIASAMDVQNEKHVIYFEGNWNKKTNQIKVINIFEKEPEFFVLTSPNDIPKKNYTVECSNGDNSWEDTCDGKFSCGSLINDCLSAGGCASICGAKIIFAPQIGTFYFETPSEIQH